MAAGLENQSNEPCFPVQGDAGRPYIVFEYVYRDAGNYKAFGELWLTGLLLARERAALEANLESGEFFVAEQVGVPPLYDRLFLETSGRISDDHAWHEVVGFRDELSLPSDVAVWGKSVDLLAAIMSASRQWKPQLSPNFDA